MGREYAPANMAVMPVMLKYTEQDASAIAETKVAKEIVRLRRWCVSLAGHALVHPGRGAPARPGGGGAAARGMGAALTTGVSLSDL